MTHFKTQLTHAIQLQRPGIAGYLRSVVRGENIEFVQDAIAPMGHAPKGKEVARGTGQKGWERDMVGTFLISLFSVILKPLIKRISNFAKFKLIFFTFSDVI